MADIIMEGLGGDEELHGVDGSYVEGPAAMGGL